MSCDKKCVKGRHRMGAMNTFSPVQKKTPQHKPDMVDNVAGVDARIDGALGIDQRSWYARSTIRKSTVPWFIRMRTSDDFQYAPLLVIMRDCFIKDPSNYSQLTETSKRIDTLHHNPGQACFKQCKQCFQPLPY